MGNDPCIQAQPATLVMTTCSTLDTPTFPQHGTWMVGLLLLLTTLDDAALLGAALLGATLLAGDGLLNALLGPLTLLAGEGLLNRLDSPEGLDGPLALLDGLPGLLGLLEDDTDLALLKGLLGLDLLGRLLADTPDDEALPALETLAPLLELRPLDGPDALLDALDSDGEEKGEETALEGTLDSAAETALLIEETERALAEERLLATLPLTLDDDIAPDAEPGTPLPDGGGPGLPLGNGPAPTQHARHVTIRGRLR